MMLMMVRWLVRLVGSVGTFVELFERSSTPLTGSNLLVLLDDCRYVWLADWLALLVTWMKIDGWCAWRMFGWMDVWMVDGGLCTVFSNTRCWLTDCQRLLRRWQYTSACLYVASTENLCYFLRLRRFLFLCFCFFFFSAKSSNLFLNSFFVLLDCLAAALVWKTSWLLAKN